MRPLESLREEHANVERALQEALRHDYGPQLSGEFYDECLLRLDRIKERIGPLAEADYHAIAKLLGELSYVSNLISLIERSRLGEFSWPFADELRGLAKILLADSDMFHQKTHPIVHVVADGRGYRIWTEDVLQAALGSRRFAIVLFQRVCTKMTVLGRQAIIAKLLDKSLTISPLLSSEQLGAASVDLRLGNVVLMVRARGSSHVDPIAAKVMAQAGTKHDAAFDRQQKHERYDIPFKTGFLLHPGSLALVPTLEWLKLPPDVVGTVTARSTWAREGLSIATATLIEPQYQGIVTLELANLGQIPLALYPGMRIAQIEFALVVGDTNRPNRSQYDLSFEPSQGTIAKEDDFPFIPDGKD